MLCVALALSWDDDVETSLCVDVVHQLSSWPYALVPSGYFLYPIMLLRSTAFLAMPVSKGEPRFPAFDPSILCSRSRGRRKASSPSSSGWSSRES